MTAALADAETTRSTIIDLVEILIFPPANQPFSATGAGSHAIGLPHRETRPS